MSGRESGGIRRFLMFKIPTKPVALTLFAITVVALVVLGFASVHHGPSREECNQMWPGRYWADGACRVNVNYHGGGPYSGM
jgi:hypothetical protein